MFQSFAVEIGTYQLYQSIGFNYGEKPEISRTVYSHTNLPCCGFRPAEQQNSGSAMCLHFLHRIVKSKFPINNLQFRDFLPDFLPRLTHFLRLSHQSKRKNKEPAGNEWLVAGSHGGAA